MCGLFGIHTMPPDHALVPPTWSPFSNNPTDAPAPAAATAAVRPVAPVPSTTTSNVSMCPPSCRLPRATVFRYLLSGVARGELPPRCADPTLEAPALGRLHHDVLVVAPVPPQRHVRRTRERGEELALGPHLAVLLPHDDVD